MIIGGNRSVRLPSRARPRPDLFLFAHRLFGGQLVLHSHLGSEDGLGSVWPQRRGKLLPEGRDRLPTQGISPRLLRKTCLVMVVMTCFVCLVSLLPGLLLQCHCGRCPPAFCMDFNHHCHHSHWHSLQFRHTGYSPGSTWGVQVQKSSYNVFCLLNI